MRLRFGRPSLPIMIIFAAIVGAVFYFFDNTNPQSEAIVTPVPTAIVADATAIPVRSEPVVIPTSATRFTESSRQEIPEDTAIFIPTAGIWSDVIQAYLDDGNWDIRDLRSNAGHLEGTAWVDQPGNVVISGHIELSNGLPGIFSNLDAIQIGQEIRIISEGLEHVYVVTDMYNTVPTDLSPLYPTDDDRLTLITCNSYDLVTNAYRERLIVVAERVS